MASRSECIVETVQRGSIAIQRPTTHTAQPSASSAPRIANASAPFERWVLEEVLLRATPTTVGVPGGEAGVVDVGFVVAGATVAGVVATGGAVVVVGTLVVGVVKEGLESGATVPGWAPLAGVAAVAVGVVVVAVLPGSLVDAGMGIPAIVR